MKSTGPQFGIGVPLDQAVFALAVMAIGACGLIAADFVAAWQPVPHELPAHLALAYLCAIVCVAAGAGLLWPRTVTVASRVLLAAFLSWMIAFRLPSIFRAPTAAVSYESWGECGVMVAAAWMIHSRWTGDSLSRGFPFAAGAHGVRVARWIFGLALVAFGISHFAYARDTAALVPSWLPAHAGWVYVTGTTYIGAGIAVLIGLAARIAALLSALQMALFTVLVWIPAVATGHADLSQWSELLDSWALAAGAWVVAESLARPYDLQKSRGG